MAEAFLNTLYHDRYAAYSAGIEPTQVNPYVIHVMQEINIDISQSPSKSMNDFRDKHFDYVVTVCDQAKEVCPFFPGDIILHQRFEDPSQFTGDEETVLANVRTIRDQIKTWIITTFSQEGRDEI
jgi:arsenate reductase